MWMALLYWKREVKQIGPGLPHAPHKVHAVRRHRARLLITHCSGQRVRAHASWRWQCPIVDGSHLYFSPTWHPEMVIYSSWVLLVTVSFSHQVCSVMSGVRKRKKKIQYEPCGLRRHVVFSLVSLKVTWLHYQNATVDQRAKTFISRHLSWESSDDVEILHIPFIIKTRFPLFSPALIGKTDLMYLLEFVCFYLLWNTL